MTPITVRTARALLAALICASLAACGPAETADAAGMVDTSRLPRVTGAKELYSNPFSTLYATPMPVAETAGAIMTSLMSGGWQVYVAPFTDYANSPDFQIMSLKKGPQALQVSVSRAPAQGNATSVSYTAIVLADDLPFPADATDIAFSPERPYLACATAKPVAEARDFFTKELTAMGWSLWPGLAIQAAKRSDNAAAPTAAHAYFVRDQRQPLHLVLHRSDDGRTKVELEAVPPAMLTAELTPDAPPKEPEMHVHAPKPADPIDDMIEDAMKQMTQAILTATGEAIANAGKPTAQRTNSEQKAPAMPTMPVMPAMTAENDAGVEVAADKRAEPASQELVAEDMDGFPIPEAHTSTHSGQTKFRTERETTVPAPLASVLAFYRRELAKRDWMEAKNAIVTADRAVLTFTSSDGRGVLTLTRTEGETAVSFVEKRESEARKAGILPKAGQAKLVMGSMAEVVAEVTINKRTIKVAPGMGGDRPDGPSLDLPPGTYAYSVKVAGAPAANEEVVVSAGETWALVIGPGGGSMPLHMY